LVWYSSDKQKSIGRSSHSEFPDVELQPMEIRTFILNLVRDNRLDKYVWYVLFTRESAYIL
jgi:hypothetical protein